MGYSRRNLGNEDRKFPKRVPEMHSRVNYKKGLLA